VEFANPLLPGRRAALQDVLVDSTAPLSWFPAAVLELLNIERVREVQFRGPTEQSDAPVGFVMVYAAGTQDCRC